MEDWLALNQFNVFDQSGMSTHGWADVSVMKHHKTRGSEEPVIAHLVFNLASKVDRKWGCYT